MKNKSSLGKITVVLCLVLTALGSSAATYYPMQSGALRLDLVSNWTTDPTGASSVSPPANFNGTGDVFNVGNGTSTAFAIGANWTVAGTLTFASGTFSVGAYTLAYSGNTVTRTSGTVNASAFGSTITMNVGGAGWSGGCGVAPGIDTTIGAGGYVKARFDQTGAYMIFGLSNVKFDSTITSNNYTQVQYGLFGGAGTLYNIQSGSYTGIGSYTSSDVFMVQLKSTGDSIVYLKQTGGIGSFVRLLAVKFNHTTPLQPSFSINAATSSMSNILVGVSYGGTIIDKPATLGRINANSFATNSNTGLTFTNSSSLTLPNSLFGSNAIYNLTANNTGSLAFGTSALTIDNLIMNGAGGVVLGDATNVSARLTLTSGVITTTSGNILNIDNMATTAISGGSSSSYVKGPMTRKLLSGISSDGTSYIYPVGDEGNYYRPFGLVNVRTGTTAPVMQVTVSQAGASTYNSPLTELYSRNWHVQALSGDFTSTTVQLADTSPAATNRVAQAATQSGDYSDIGNTSFGGDSINSNSGILLSNGGYFALGASVFSCTAPGMQATIGAFTSTTASGVTVNWTRGDGDSVMVVGRLSSATSIDPSGGVSYSANAAFGLGSTTGVGNYILYKGTGTSAIVTGLSASTAYTFTVYEYNATGPCYLAPGSALADTTFCTFSSSTAPELCAGATTTITPEDVSADPATGGTVSSSGGYYIHSFTSGGSFVIPYNVTAEVLVVAGGGGGAGQTGGGGGAGGLVYNSSFAVSANTYSITVGAGGAGGATNGNGFNGSNSSFSSISATGGGRGGTNGNAGGNGGSGGGAGAAGGAGGTGSGQGSNGGSGFNGSNYGCGGGGGAGGVGVNGTATVGGNGGAGLAYSISGSSVYYSGGGGGGTYLGGTLGSGGLGGGGNAGADGNNGASGAPNTGGGGGGGKNNAGTGGSGGSGIVIIKYQPPSATGAWTSSDDDIATVSSGGVVTAVSTGVAIIKYTVTIGGCTHVQQWSVNVNASPDIQASDGNVTSVTTSGATINWTRGNGSNVLAVVREISEAAADPTPGNTYTANSAFGSGSTTGDGNFVVYNSSGISVAVSALNSSTEYVVALYEYSGAGCFTASAHTFSFTTASLGCTPPTSQASVGAFTATGISTTTVNWTRGNGDSVLVVGRLTSSSGVDPDNGTAYSTNSIFGSGDITGADNFAMYKGTGTSITVSGLSASTGYTFTVFEYKTAATCYRTPGSSGAVTTTCVPSSQAAIGAFTTTTATGTTVSWARGNGDSVLVVGRLTATSGINPSSGSHYSANTVFGSGGTTGSDNFVIYKGTATGVSVTGLSASTEYTFTVYEYNHTGVCYKTPGSSSTVTTVCDYTVSGPSFVCSGGTATLSPPTFNAATGGTLTISGGFNIHTFTTTGLTFNSNSVTNVEVLAVGGGGGGGGGTGGGGGAGALIHNTSFSISPGTGYPVTVGSGGPAGPAGCCNNPAFNGGPGGNSVFHTLTAMGGGYGGSHSHAGGTGGSGGGGSVGGGAGTTSGSGLVNIGGTGFASSGWGAGGGGGANGAGANGNSTNGGNGGAGVSNSISGSAVTYAGGGGGGIYSGTYGTGGSGIGGNGGANGFPGATNTGSGGGGGSANAGTGGAGGSGIVIVKYPIPTGGSWSSSNESIATVNSSGVVTGVTTGSATISYTYSIGSCIYTQATPVTVDATPGTQASGGSASSVGANGATLHWTRGNGSNVLAVVRLTSGTTTDPSIGASYSANTVFGSGGTTGSGNHAVYNNTDSSVAITGLTSGTGYTCTLYEYNGTGCYLTSGYSFTFTTLSTEIALSDNGTQVAASSVNGCSANVLLHKSALAVTVGSTTLTGMTATTAGSYVSADIANLKVYYSTSNTFSVAGATLLSTFTIPGAVGVKTFPSFIAQPIAEGSTGYVYITADIASGYTVSNAISINALTTADFTFSTGNKTGSASNGGAQTIASPPTITGVTNATICSAGTVNLAASSSGGTINWYAASTGGSSLATGTTYFPTIYTTTTYYVDAASGDLTPGCIPRTAVTGTVVAQTGTGVITSNAVPFNSSGGTNISVSGNDITVTGNVTMTSGTYNFRNFTVNSGAIVSVAGSVPLVINCSETATIAGTIDLAGKNGGDNSNICTIGGSRTGGAGGAGGGGGGVSGGAGGNSTSSSGTTTVGSPGLSFGSFSGHGLGGGKPSNYGLGGGGGGGGGASYGVLGVVGGNGSSGSFGTTGGVGGVRGTVYGDAAISTIYNSSVLLGGSGGGGGGASAGNPSRSSGAGGGGGGGAIGLTANAIDLTGGLITVKGGNGGNGTAGASCVSHTDAYAAAGGGGGGSGGTVLFNHLAGCTSCTVGATINISGGTGGTGVSWNGATGGNGGTGGAGRFLATSLFPTITLGTNPSVCSGSTSANLPYTATTGSPSQYKITYDAAAQTAGFANVGLTSLPASPITLAIPAGAAPGTYNGSIYVSQSGDSCGAGASFTVTLTSCSFSYSVNVFLQGYYLGGNKMSPLLSLLGAVSATDADTVTVELHRATTPYDSLYAYKGVLNAGGVVTCIFPSGALNGSFYIVVKHRNSLETWSAAAQTTGSGGSYNFTTGAEQAYGSNMIDLGGGVYGIYNGDVNSNGAIDASDKSSLQSALPAFMVGGYNVNDITGDGFVDEDDYRLLQNNAPLAKAISRP